MEIGEKDFNIIRDYIKGACGIDLSAEKKYLVEQRLESVAQAQGCANFREFALLLRACKDPVVNDQVVAAITTNETSFFRDNHPFETFRSILLPQLAEIAVQRKKRPIERKGAKISIWSAASSTGQEPYCLSIIIHDFLSARPNLNLVPDDFVIVATDISSKVLARAIAGEYSELEAGRGLTEAQKAAYFRREGDKLVIKDHLRRIVDFRRINLNESFLHLGGFDVIYCRNVLIYFDVETRRRIFDQFYKMLTDDGVLVLGSTESVYGISTMFESHHVGASVYFTKNVGGSQSPVVSPMVRAAGLA